MGYVYLCCRDRRRLCAGKRPFGRRADDGVYHLTAAVNPFLFKLGTAASAHLNWRLIKKYYINWWYYFTITFIINVIFAIPVIVTSSIRRVTAVAIFDHVTRSAYYISGLSSWIRYGGKSGGALGRSSPPSKKKVVYYLRAHKLKANPIATIPLFMPIDY